MVRQHFVNLTFSLRNLYNFLMHLVTNISPIMIIIIIIIMIIIMIIIIIIIIIMIIIMIIIISPIIMYQMRKMLT